MKSWKLLSILIIVVLLFVMVGPASAQLGDTDISQFTIQNVSGSQVTVRVTFYNENGIAYTPTQLDNNNPTQLPNPFTLNDGESRQVYVPNIPTAQLPAGRYSVVISSTGRVVAVAAVAGTGSKRFTGNYTGFSIGAQTVYLATIAYNYFGWYGMVSVQNLGSSAANVTLTITCQGGSPVGTLTANNIPSMASYTFVLKNTVPTGFTSSTQCIGAGVVTANQNIAVVNNQNMPSNGRTNTFEGAVQGYTKLYVPHLQNNYFGWVSALNIMKLGSGNTTVTVDYDDAESNDTCNLTDAAPSCQLYMPTVHPTQGRFGAIITSSPSMPLLAVVGASNNTLSGAYTGFGAGSNVVAVPLVQKLYYGWNTAVTCQNVSTASTTLHLAYQGYPAYDHPQTLTEGQSVQIYVPNESFLPNGYLGGLTITANNASANIACIVGSSNPSNLALTPGDWTVQYNAFAR